MPVFPVYSTAEVVNDPELAARDFWVELPHPEVGTRRHAGIPWRFSGTPLRVSCPAPTLGQHTEEVLREVLELSGAEIDRLRVQGVLP